MSNVNDGHIIIRERDSMERGIRDATVAVLEHDRAVMKHRQMPRMNEDGFYEVEQKKPEPRLKYHEVRALAESFAALHNFKCRVDIDDNQAKVELRRPYDRTKKNATGFSARYPPTETQLRSTLGDCAASIPY